MMCNIFSAGLASVGAVKSDSGRMSAKQSNGRIGDLEASRKAEAQLLHGQGSTLESSTQSSVSRRSARILFVLLAFCLVWAAPTGVFAQEAIFSGAQATISTGSVSGVAVDKAGNIFFAEPTYLGIEKLPAGGDDPSQVVSGLPEPPQAVAVDGAGNIYVAISGEILGGGAVLKIPPVGTGYGTPVSVGTGLYVPVSLAVDAAGDLFVGDVGNEYIVEIPANGGSQITFALGSTPWGLAVDAAGDLFISDGSADAYELLPNRTTWRTLATDLYDPSGIAVDEAGNVFVVDSGNNRLVEIPAGGSEKTLVSGLNAPEGVAVNAAGAVFIADSGNEQVVEMQTRSVDFGSSLACPYGQTSIAPCSRVLTLNLELFPGIVGQPATFTTRIFTQGAQNQDFALSSESCGMFNRAGYFCELKVIFSPKFPGLRQGALQVTASSGGAVLTAPLFGFGFSAQVAFNSSAQTTIPASGLNSPVAVATDGAGDVFIVDTDNNRLVEAPAGGGAQVTLDSELVNPLGVAVDGAGDLFIADHGNHRVVEIPSGGGAWQTVGTGLAGPAGVAVDGAGDVYIADYTNNQVVEVPAGGAPQKIVASAADGLSGPRGMALDWSGNLYIANSESALVLKVPPGGAAKTTVGTGLSAPYGVAVDAAGDVYIADYESNSVVEVPADGPQMTLGSGLRNPTGVALDGAGDVFVADYDNARVLELHRSQPPALSFAATDVHSTSTDSPQSTVLENIGTDPLYVHKLIYPSDFPEDAAAEASQGSCNTPYAINPGQVCALAVNFSPLHAGALNESLAITDDTLNAVGSTQSIALSGTGLADAPALLTSPAAGSTLTGPSQTFTWSAGVGATAYQLWIGNTGVNSNNIYSSGVITATSATPVNLPLNGAPVYVRLYTGFNGNWAHEDYTFIATLPAALTAPAPGSTFTGPSQTFTWSTGVGVTAYQLWIGTTGVNSNNVYSSGVITATSATPVNLPLNGAPIYVRLYTDFNGTWVHEDYTFVATLLAALTVPVPGGLLTGPTTTFAWTAATGATAYQLWLGSTGVNSNDLYSSGAITATSVTRTNLPTNGETIYARLFTNFNGTWVSVNYTFTAVQQSAPVSPAAGSVLTGASVTFTWSVATGETGYQFWLGTTGVGSNNLYSSGATTATSVTRSNLPTNGETIYARLYTNYNGTWVHTDYTFTAAQ